jgi:hypothetical protein
MWRGNERNCFFNLYRRIQPVTCKLNFIVYICKGRFSNNMIAFTVVSYFAKLLTLAASRIFYRISMISQPVVKNNGRRNAEGKYDQ